MFDPAIQEFFDKRKTDWLNKKIKSSMPEDEVQIIEREAEYKFSPQQWLPDAAKRAGQMSITTHPCTFSHPSARKNKSGYVTSIVAKINRIPDGYLKTGNVEGENDAVGNAAVLDVYKFLMLTLKDGDTLLEHIEKDSDLAKELLSLPSGGYEVIKDGLTSMIKSESKDMLTSSKIKQVYFPVEGNSYHLISVLSNSGLVFELRKRIDDLRFSDKHKELRELKRNNRYSEQGFSEIYDITTVGYGGTKPQNISVLNNQYGGKARLLSSIPPQLTKRDIQFPSKDFFKSAIRFYDIREPLQKLHGIFKIGLDSPIPRRNLESGRDNSIEDILDRIIERMASLRTVSIEQYREEISALPHYQKVWLCEPYLEVRQQQDEWLDELCEVISKWILAAYRKVVKKPLTLGPAERNYIHELIDSYREALR